MPLASQTLFCPAILVAMSIEAVFRAYMLLTLASLLWPTGAKDFQYTHLSSGLALSDFISLCLCVICPALIRTVCRVGTIVALAIEPNSLTLGRLTLGDPFVS
ncbi:unnamed protein product [Protopolystoma xenopodis]|uniref:Uncharacterized protein n=1 Tax=Protopolystoma xenopodis TaxID=117903 RepID=A0A448WT45_9PLAT|nr:unnamed protein product [Protopolystoma xenopodis]